MRSKLAIFIIFLLSGIFFSSYGQNMELKAVGKTDLETKVIDSIGYLNKFKDYNSMQVEVDTIASKLIRAGYIDSRLLGITQTNDSLFKAAYELNQRYRNITITHNGLIEKDILLLLNLNDQGNTFTIPIETLESTLENINAEIANRGKPFSSLRLINITKASTTDLAAELEISQPISRTIDKIIIKGYEKFPKSFIKRYLKIKVGQEFNLTQINEKTSELSDLRFANQIKDPEVLFTKDWEVKGIDMNSNTFFWNHNMMRHKTSTS